MPRHTTIRLRGGDVPLYWPPVAGLLYSLAGPVSKNVPVVLQYVGKSSVAATAANRLRAMGYRVRVKRGPADMQPSPEMPRPPSRSVVEVTPPPPASFLS